MDIRESQGPGIKDILESESSLACHRCAAEIQDGDRFCQQCGERVSTVRARLAGAKRSAAQSEASEKSSKLKAPKSVSLICINCGNRNQASDTQCSGCDIQLVASLARTPSLRLSNRAGKEKDLDPNNIVANPKIDNSEFDHSAEGSTTARKGEETNSKRRKTADLPISPKLAAEAREKPLCAEPPELFPIAHDTNKDSCNKVATFHAAEHAMTDSQPSARGETPSLSTSEFESRKNESTILKIRTRPLPPPTAPETDALSNLYPDEKDKSSSGDTIFDRLSRDTGSPRLGISFTSSLYFFESIFEKIPIPVLFLIGAFLVITVSVKLNTEWTKAEQRLRGLDNIAKNAEVDMLAARFSQAVDTLSELEKTEKGDLPPKARAILNQSLWLRSYVYAKEHDYENAVADLKRVTPAFDSFSDVTEKLSEYEKILVHHPELSRQKKRRGEPNAARAQKKIARRTSERNKRRLASNENAPQNSDRETVTITESKSRSAKFEENRTSKSRNDDATEPRRQTASRKTTGENNHGNQKKESEIQAGHQSSAASGKGSSLERYNSYLVRFFSSSESQETKNSEPLSFDEWKERN